MASSASRLQPLDLRGLPGRVGGRQAVPGLELADLLGALEALGEQVHQGGIEVVDAAAQVKQPLTGRLVGNGGRFAGRRCCPVAHVRLAIRGRSGAWCAVLHRVDHA